MGILVDAERANRLRQARVAAGYRTAMAAAKALNMAPATYRCHENATRGFMNDFAQKYARFFRVPYEWLQTGKGQITKEKTASLVGYVGAGAEVFPIDDGPLGSAPVPPNGDFLAEVVTVKGDSMYPAYTDGDLIYLKEKLNSLADALGRECMVGVEDGRRLLKMVTRGHSKNRFTLISYNAPPIENVKLEWAAPVDWIKRR